MYLKTVEWVTLLLLNHDTRLLIVAVVKVYKILCPVVVLNL
jgi:hypothetical protein